MNKKKLTKKSIILRTIIVLIAVSIVIGIYVLNKTQKIDKSTMSSELQRTQAYDDVKDGDNAIKDNAGNTVNAVKFDAFFLKDKNGDGVAESIRGTCNEIGSQASLYMELSVLEQGRLKDGKIIINSNNFYFNTTIVKDNEVKENYISSNTKEINFNEIGNGTQKLLIGSVRSGDYSNSYTKTSAIGNDTTKYSKENSITFSGTFVDNEGNETTFSKEVPFTVDWYGETHVEIDPKSQTVEVTEMNDLSTEDGVKLNFNIRTVENKNQLSISSSEISGTIPELNGYKPTSVKIFGTNVTYTYDAETSEFTAQRTAVLDETGVITSNGYSYSYSSGNRYTEFNFEITYPEEAYTALGQDVTSFELAIPIQAVTRGYNNPNEEDGFISPYVSNTATGIVTTTWKKHVGQLYDFAIYVGTYMGSPYNTYVIQKKKPLKIYNGISAEEKNDTYLVQWRAYTGSNGATDGIIMNETTGKTDSFLNTSAKYESMDELTTNVGIYFSGANNALNSDGWIKVYDADTDTLINTFTEEDWSDYSSTNPYKYENAVKHIRVETSNTNEECYFYVNNIKELDDEYITTKYTKEEFDNLSYISSYLDGKMIKPKTDENEETTYCFKESESNRALYQAPTSVATISIKDNTISTHVTAEHQQITISTQTSGYNEQGWKNSSFLVQLPSEIILGEINTVTTNNSNVKITAYDIYEENGNYYIRILTENSNEETFNIIVDCDLTPDPRIAKTTKYVKLWAKNGIASDYYYSAQDTYDVDGNSNTTEKVNYRETSFTFDPGSSLSTTQIGSDYDGEGGITIAPRVAKTDKNQRTAKITVSATNNYTYDIQDLKILGVIPFEGNQFVISGNDLGSTFTTYISKGGLSTITNSIKDKVKIYYSTTERPSKDVEDLANDWKLANDVEDWTKIKTYLIVLDNSYKLSSGDKIEFEYEINLPEGIDYNKIAYSEHAIYFALNTDEGLYYTSTGSAKLGFMIAKQYDLEIVKYQKDTEKTLQGITFAITEDGAETSTIKTTNADGKLLVTGLYAERYYTIKEIKTTDDYVLNQEEIRFYTYTKINEDGSESLYLTYPNKENESTHLNVIYKTVRNDQVNPPSNGKDYKIQVKVNNEVKAKLKINKTDLSGNVLKNVKFILTGEGKNGEILTTDKNGDINTSGLLLGKEYTLEEIKATGYYIPQTKIKFTISNNNGNFELNYTDNNTTKTKQIITTDEIPTIELNLQNEKIPTYSLQLTKYAKGEKDTNGNDKKLAKAQYLIKGEGIKDEGKIYTTDDNGVLTINDLYEYVEGKYITGEYILKEIYAPEGYSLDSTELKFKAYRENGTLKIQILEGDSVIRKITVEGVDKTDLNIKDATTSNAIIEIGVEDGQIFSIYKYYQDGTSSAKKPIPGTRFKITDLNGNYVTGSDGKTVGQWFDTTQEQLPVPDITLSSTGTYQWTQRDDGTWESTGCYNVNSATGTLTSNEFVLKQNATLQFEWTVSSEGGNYDYAYYTITNVETNKTVNGTGTSTKIGGTDNGTTYESLKFLKVSLDLEPGKYKIEFTYRKDGSVNKGLDAAFVKNIKFKEVEKTGYYAVTTDTNGQITANLPEGLYKAIEVYTNDRYVLPEKEADRTYYFGIGSSQAATWDWVTGLTGEGWNYVNSVSAQKDGGVIAVGSFSKYSTDVVANAVDGIDIDNDGTVDEISEGSNDGLIISYDTDGKVVWSKTFGGDSDDSLNKVIQTSDGGYVAVGYAESNSIKYDGKIISELSRTSTENLSQKDAILLKISKNGTYEWGLRIGGTGDDEIQSVIETSEGNFAITGNYYSSLFNFYDRAGTEVKGTMTNTGERDAFVASYSSTGIYQWSSAIGGTNNQDAPDLTEYSAGIAVASNSSTLARISLYSLTGSAIKSAFIGSGTSKITSLDTYTDGTIIAGVNYTGTQFDAVDAGIYKVTTTGSSTRIYELTGTYDDEYVSDVQVTSDGGILFGGWYYSTDTAGSDGTTFDEKSGEYACDGYVIKLNSKNVVEYSSRLYGDNYDGVNTVTETRNGALVSGGFFNSSTLSATNCKIEKDEGDTTPEEQMLTRVKNSDAFVIAEGSAGAEVPEAQKIEVENQIKTFKITTEVKKNNNVAGGDIDGQVGVTIDGVNYSKDGIRYVEKVKYGENSKNAIKITPNAKYVIDSIIINGKEYTNFTTAEDGTVTLPIFDNVLEDKHIVVQFSNTMANIEVNHYLWTKADGPITTKVAETQTSTGEVGTTYETSPNTDIEYVIITNSDYYGENLPEGVVGSDYYIPANYKGTYTEGTKEVINYYYKEKTYKLTVHHYLDGTTESVPLKDSTTGEKVADEITEDLKKNSEYTTTQAGETKIDYSIYELVSIPENATGTIQEDIEVTYYYKIKTADIRITKVAEEDHEKTLADTQFVLYQFVGTTSKDELIDTKNVSSDWKLIGTYATSNLGILKLENLPINEEYRLIEIKATEGRIIPDGQWKIQFVTGDYDTTDTSIVTINGVPFKINAIGNPPAMIKTDDGKLLLPNKAYYNFPTSGSIELKMFYQTGMIIVAIGVVIMALIIVKRCYVKNTKKVKKGRKH